MGCLFLLLIIAMAVATFIENDYGAAVARNQVYNAKWFELLFLLLIINMAGHIFEYKLLRKEKITALIFHLAFIIIILGAAITRYTGFDGLIHIREGQSQNICQSAGDYLNLKIKDKEGDLLYQTYKKYSSTKFRSFKFNKTVDVESEKYELRFQKYIPNASQVIKDVPEGKPLIALLLSKSMMRETVYITQGEQIQRRGFKITFDAEDSDLNFSLKNDTFYMNSAWDIAETSMMSRETKFLPPQVETPLKPMQIYQVNGWRFVVQQLSRSGSIEVVAIDPNMQQTKRSVFEFELMHNDISENIYLWFSDFDRPSAEIKTEHHNVELSYGPRELELPFSLRLNDFILERYPGSNSPSSYMSNVTLIDKANNTEKEHMVFMNNILKYKGYRFYQSSYDKDEKGTVLSVNKDKVGIIVTYFGYFLLFAFVLLSLINRKSVFHKIKSSYWSSPLSKKAAGVLIVLFSSLFVFGNENRLEVNKQMAEEFGKILIQDQSGRTKPLYTLSNDVLRKVSRESEFNDYTSMQVYLGLYFDFANWKDYPMIKVSNDEVRKIIGIQGKYAAFTDVVDMSNRISVYKIEKLVNDAYAKAAGKRNKFDKEIIKLDERVNICYLIGTGEFMKIFPVKDTIDHWESPVQAFKYARSAEDSLYLSNILPLTLEALASGDSDSFMQYVNSIISYQKKFATYELPGEMQVKTEVAYYKYRIFDRLFPFYATVGLVILILLLIEIINGKVRLKLVFRIFAAILGLGFLAHTSGIAMRWYISGHAPMSNGYESMIFISWVTILAGFIFSRKSYFALCATAVLAGLTLMVAHLSFMDPQITNLVPVLKSYWLTLHVSIITGSYGFLGLGAILGLITMVLFSFIHNGNSERIVKTIEELTVINYKTITLGLYFLVIGTFLGAIWANESWGRYWGWDPKETWSLITILVYSIVIHSRMIKPLKSIYAFNVLTLFAFLSILMTYFGVNYYLSGLHSYAGGDSVPVPLFVYISLVVMIFITIFAFLRYKVLIKRI